MILIVDTETSGLPGRGMPLTHPRYPRIVELGMVLIDGDRERQSVNLIIKPEGWEVPAEAAAIHGIDHALATRVGVPIRAAIATYAHLMRCADEVVGHNVRFDLDLIGAELLRLGRDLVDYRPRAVVDTAEVATPVVRLPPTERMIAAGLGDRFKTPTLGECYRFLFNEELTGAHGAMIDCRACWRVLRELRDRDERRAGEASRDQERGPGPGRAVPDAA